MLEIQEFKEINSEIDLIFLTNIAKAMGVSQDLKDKGYALLCVAKVIEDIEVETTYYDEVYDLQFGQYFGKGKTRKAPPWEFEED